MKRKECYEDILKLHAQDIPQIQIARLYECRESWSRKKGSLVNMAERENGNSPRPQSQPHLDPTYSWVARVHFSEKNEVTAYTGTHAFSIGKQASFTHTIHPTAVDYLLGALGGDLLCGLQAIASRRGVTIDAMETRVSGSLNNPLVFLGVIGEQGHPGLEAITCTLYVSADVSEAVLQDLWQVALSRSPLVHTLQRCVDLSLSLQQIL